MEKIRIVVVDDHTIVREGIEHLLATFKNVTVVGKAGDGFEAIKIAQKEKPDIMILDISMPKLRGIEAIREVKLVSPETRVIILSMYHIEEYIKQSLANGASGYLLKDSASEELNSAIRFVMQDQIYLSPAIARAIVTNWLTEPEINGTKKDGVLSTREIEVLKLLAEGYSNKEIANLLHISSKTIETHRYRIMDKLELNNFADLVKYAIKEQLIELS
ncbi:MAG TPA: response regulator transcription factor [bacterium]|nr:response regulator transcription factor [bacterium]HPN43035.1 response regulator transcription factor [bacterium]